VALVAGEDRRKTVYNALVAIDDQILPKLKTRASNLSISRTRARTWFRFGGRPHCSKRTLHHRNGDVEIAQLRGVHHVDQEHGAGRARAHGKGLLSRGVPPDPLQHAGRRAGHAAVLGRHRD
jgi:hypothetical protein